VHFLLGVMRTIVGAALICRNPRRHAFGSWLTCTEGQPGVSGSAFELIHYRTRLR
jgi:hypothetical protein